MTKLMVAFGNFPNAPKILICDRYIYIYIYIHTHDLFIIDRPDTNVSAPLSLCIHLSF